MEPNALRDQVTPERLLHDMDEYNACNAIVLASEALSNETLSKIVKDHPKRLRGYAYINPLEDDSPHVLEYAVTRLGLIGLKLVPDFQDFSMADPRIHPLLKKAAELDIPVMVHSAPGLVQGHYNQSLPEHFDSIKRMIPRLTLIISHMSYPLFLDLLNIVPKEGVYVDTSTSLLWIYDLYGGDFTGRYIRRIGADNVIFGSDWWSYGGEIGKQIELINKLDLTVDEKDKILGGNISKIHGI
jgi:predicted TIM-barrel fold metal-dependent hydrolase